MQRAYLYWISWSVVIALAIWLRMDGLSNRPVHADEATGARILAERIEDNGYAFNPKHFHGPFLSFISQPIAKIRGEDSWSDLTVTTLRLGVLIAGILTVLTPLLWIRVLGHLPSLVSGALLATSPLLVYYNRMFIHESWLLLFGLISLYAIYRLLNRPNTLNAVFAGVFVGLMFATKETFAISIISWSLASIVYLLAQRQTGGHKPKISQYLKPIAVGAITALIVGAAFFTNWFTQPKAFLDALQTFFVYETTPGHEKHLMYYLELLVWPKYLLGNWWSEGVIILLGLIAAISSYTKRKDLPLLILLILAALIHLLIYSIIAYKTPWLMLLPWAQFILLAGLAFRHLDQDSKLVKGVLCAALVIGLCFQTKQSLNAAGKYSNDTRNPYAYVPTSKNIQSLKSWLQDLDAVQSIQPIAVVGTGYWPLPWYLKNFEQVGYWPSVSKDIADLALVISMDAESAACAELLESTHIQLPRSLRENVSISVFLRNDLWETWNKEAP